MLYAKDTIKNDVRVAIDENRTANNIDDSYVSADTLEMNHIIESKIEDGINTVCLVAPLHMLAVTTRTFNTNGETFPDDLLRFVKIEGTGWKKAVTELSQPNEQTYSEFPGIAPNATRPALVADGNMLIPLPKPTSATLYYVKSATATSNQYNIPQRIYRACIYKIAALVMANYENGNLLQLLNSLCLEQLGLSAKQ